MQGQCANGGNIFAFKYLDIYQNLKKSVKLMQGKCASVVYKLEI